MQITLKPELAIKLRSFVAAGNFASVEEAAQQLIEDRMADIAIEEQDEMAWALPLVDEARVAVARGDVITLEEHRARNAKRLAALGA